MTTYLADAHTLRETGVAVYDEMRHITDAGQRVRVEVKAHKSSKSRDQEELYHSIIAEIARAKTLRGKTLGPESWKRLLLDAFKHETKDDADLKAEWAKFGSVELLPALNHDGFVMVGNQSRRFSVKLATAFIDWLQAFQASTDTEVMA